MGISAICPLRAAHLELEGVAVGPLAEVPVPDGAVVHVLLGEGCGGGEAAVVGQRRAPPLRGAVSRRGHQHHLTWTGDVQGERSLFLLLFASVTLSSLVPNTIVFQCSPPVVESGVARLFNSNVFPPS